MYGAFADGGWRIHSEMVDICDGMSQSSVGIVGRVIELWLICMGGKPECDIIVLVLDLIVGMILLTK